MPVIKFVKEKKEIEVPRGANLRDEAIKAGINLNCAMNGVSEGIDQFTESVSKVFNCHGFGMCGTCRVKITVGIENTNPLTLREKVKLKYLPVPYPIPEMAYLANEDTMRFLYLTVVNGSLTVETKHELNVFGDNFFS